MASLSDKGPRSERRRRQHQVLVRLNSDEFFQLQEIVDERNAGLGPEHSASTKTTIQEVLVTSALGRQFRPTLADVQQARRAVDPDLRKASADLASLGNMLKAWGEYGNGVFRGNSPQHSLTFHRAPDTDEIATIKDLLSVIAATTTKIKGFV